MSRKASGTAQAALDVPATAKGPVGTTLANVDVINHLLFHKSIISDDEDGSRINKYLELVHEGEHLTIKDEFDRSVALAFELVLQEQLNPWDIDLVKFATLYLDRAKKEDLDLVTAGRVILLAWGVLKLQSDDLVHRTETREEDELLWDEMPDFDFSDEDVDFTQRVRTLPRAPIDEKVWHEGDRKVTLMELMEAFETARDEASKRVQVEAAREHLRDQRRKAAQRFTRNRVHKEDQEEDTEEIWRRIGGLNGDEFPLTRIFRRGDLDDFVMAFNSVLFLHRDRRIDVRQPNFPEGDILLRNRQAEAKEEAA